MATTVRSRAARTLGERRVVMWEYAPDVERDMFQFGRLDGASSRNDHVIRGRLHRDARVGKTGPTSRYAFRVLCDRDGSSAPRIFAAGFDSRRRVRIGQRAPRWAAAPSEWRAESSGGARGDKGDEVDELNQQRWDAMTTFGIRIWSRAARAWFEVSVNGAIHALRPSYSSTSAAPQLVGKPIVQSLITNELVSGTIVDSCGVLLMWEGPEHERAALRGGGGRMDGGDGGGSGGGGDAVGGRRGGGAEGGKARLEARRVQCPVMMHTLKFPSAALASALARGSSSSRDASSHPRREGRRAGGGDGEGSSASSSSSADAWVFTACGHVLARSRELCAMQLCPMCRTPGPFKPLIVRASPSPLLMMPGAAPTHVYACGCATSKAEAAFWTGVPVPTLSGGAIGTVHSAVAALCPHCSSPIAEEGAVRLFFADEIDSASEVKEGAARSGGEDDDGGGGRGGGGDGGGSGGGGGGGAPKPPTPPSQAPTPSAPPVGGAFVRGDIGALITAVARNQIV